MCTHGDCADLFKLRLALSQVLTLLLPILRMLSLVASGCRMWTLHKARYRFGRWTCNHDSFSNTTKTRISALGAGREGPYTLLLFTGSSCLCVTQRDFAGTVICHCCHARTHVTAGREEVLLVKRLWWFGCYGRGWRLAGSSIGGWGLFLE